MTAPPPSAEEAARQCNELKKTIGNILDNIGAEMDGPYGDDAVPIVRAGDLVEVRDIIYAFILSREAEARKQEREAAAQCADRVAEPSKRPDALKGDMGTGMIIAASAIAQSIRARSGA